jgi:hypothetical protein
MKSSAAVEASVRSLFSADLIDVPGRKDKGAPILTPVK